MVPISSFYQDFRGRKVSFRKKQFFVMKNGADRGLSFVFMKNYAFDLNLKFQARHYQIIFIQLDVIGT